jgi:hypothetical protein
VEPPCKRNENIRRIADGFFSGAAAELDAHEGVVGEGIGG